MSSDGRSGLNEERKFAYISTFSYTIVSYNFSNDHDHLFYEQ